MEINCCAKKEFNNMRTNTFTVNLQRHDSETDKKILIGKLCADIRNESLNIQPFFLLSAAFKVLDECTQEFVKNSLDAVATQMQFNFLSKENNQIEINIIDNGIKKIPNKKLGQYDWRQALFEDSTKKNSEEEQLGGRNLGLAIITHFLEKKGDGYLSLHQNVGGNGATVALTSSSDDCSEMHVMVDGENYIHQMTYDLLSESAQRFSEEEIELIKAKHQYPEGYCPPDECEEIAMMLPASPVSRRSALTGSTTEDTLGRISAIFGGIHSLFPSRENLSALDESISLRKPRSTTATPMF